MKNKFRPLCFVCGHILTPACLHLVLPSSVNTRGTPPPPALLERVAMATVSCGNLDGISGYYYVITRGRRAH